MTHGSLFSGAGGFDLAAEREGFKNVFHSEILPYANKILQQHFPNSQPLHDVTQIKSLPYADVVSAGFPCQDISSANVKATGIFGERSGLIFTALDLLCRSRPRYIIMENSPYITHRGMQHILQRLAKGGYNAEWQTVCASWFGYPHIRERMFIVAYPNTQRQYTALFRREQIKSLFSSWSSKPTAIHLAAAINERQANSGDIRRGARIPHNMDRIALMGNAVNVTVAQYVLRCIKIHSGL